MASVLVAGTPANVLSGSDLPVILQNTGVNTIFIGEDINVSATPQYNFIPPNASFKWPPRSPLFAICAHGQSSTIAFMPNGADIGVASVTTSLTAPQYLSAPKANSLYISNYSQPVGVYTIACPVGTIATIKFYDSNNNLIISGTTVSGVLTITLLTPASYLTYITNGTGITITLTLTGTNLPYSAKSFIFGISGFNGDNGLG